MPSSAYMPPPLYTHSFPTRRSSDLRADVQRIHVELRSVLQSRGRGRRWLERHARTGDCRPHRARGRQFDRYHRRAWRRLSRRSIPEDRKSTRLNSSHLGISYAVFCLYATPPVHTLLPYTTLFRSPGRRPTDTRRTSVRSAIARTGTAMVGTTRSNRGLPTSPSPRSSIRPIPPTCLASTISQVNP